LPLGKSFNIPGAHEAPILLPQQIFEQHANGKRELRNMSNAAPLQRV
jgi:hypothetical protein